jgi:phage terminase large subunit
MASQTEKIKIQLPNNWRPRAYQVPLWNYLIDGGKRAMAIWHRRAGKDDIALHFTACAASERPANFWHCLPEYAQGRRAIWTAVNPHSGKRRIDEAFPHDLRESTNDNEMFIRFKNGSTWQVIGSDRYDATMGSSAAGIVYSEWALAHPGAWGYHRPILEENNGFALFITTPRGRNHAKTMFDMASQDLGWFVSLLTARDTLALNPDQLDAALKEYISLFGRDVGGAQFEQEYNCNFNAAILGAYFALEMLDVRRENRIVAVEADPDLPMHRAWDIGVRDDTAVWFFQIRGGQIILHDVYGASTAGVEHYAEVIERKRAMHGWNDGTDYVPQDAKVLEWGAGRTRVESMLAFGLHPFVVGAASKLDGIEAARRTLPFCVFHPRTEEIGVAALEQYQREWDPELKAFKMEEKRNWTTHYADAFRYLSLAWKLLPIAKPAERKREGWVIPPPDEPTIRQPGRIRL